MQKLSARLGVHDVPPAPTPLPLHLFLPLLLATGKFTAARAFSFAFTVFGLSFILLCFLSPFFILFICPRFMSHAGRQACRNIFARTHTHTPVGHIRSQKVSVYVSVMNMYVFIMKRVDGEAGRSFLQHRKCSTTLDWHMNYILIIQPDSVGVLTFAL